MNIQTQKDASEGIESKLAFCVSNSPLTLIITVLDKNYAS